MKLARCLAAEVAVAAIASADQVPFIREWAFGAGLSQTLFDELSELAKLVDISYCVGLVGEPLLRPSFECPSFCDQFPSLELVTTWNTGPLLSDSCGYIAVDHDDANRRIIVSFRGTYSLSNAIVDLSAIPQRYVPYDHGARCGDLNLQANQSICDSCSVHAGFMSSWDDSRKAIMPVLQETILAYPESELIVLGHSLGAAVGLLAALEFQACGWGPRVTTFGEPRVGNTEFAHYIDKRLPDYRRVTHVADPVPLLPPAELGYFSHARELFIAKSELPPEAEDIRICEGSDDPQCIAGPKSILDPGLSLYGHRDYFHRLGLCVQGDIGPWEL